MLRVRFQCAGSVQSEVDMPACIAANIHTSFNICLTVHH